MDRVFDITGESGGQGGRRTITSSVLLKVRLDALASTTRISSVAHIAVAILVAVAHRNVASPSLMGAWIAILAVLTITRYLLARSYGCEQPRSWTLWHWECAAVIQAAILGLTWGMAGFWLAWQGDIFLNNLLVCASLCLAVGSLVNVAYWPVHFAFQMPLLLIEAAGFATSGNPGAMYFAGGLLVSCVAISLLAPRLGAHVTSAFRLAEEKRVLLEELQHSNFLLQRLAATDGLTGLANRHTLEAVLRYEWERAQRGGESIGCLMIDVDHFKTFNDRYGHLAGDLGLRRLAGLIGEGVRSGIDLAARYGGEEFILILPETGIAQAMRVAERLRHTAAQTRHLEHGRDAGILTVSIGVAAMIPSAEASPEELISAADAALYAAKASGRNKVQASDKRVTLVA